MLTVWEKVAEAPGMVDRLREQIARLGIENAEFRVMDAQRMDLEDGTVDGATIEECSREGLGFEAAALAAVKRWRYEPAPLQSGPRSVTVTIHFQSQEARP